MSKVQTNTLENVAGTKSATVDDIVDATIKALGIDTKSLATAWGSVNGIAPSLTEQFNVSSVVKDSTGNYTITFQTAMDNENFSAVGSAEVSGRFFSVTSKTVNGFSLNIRVHDGSSPDANFSFNVFGGKN